MAWKGESRRHSLARKGVRRAKPQMNAMGKNSPKINYMGEGRSMHGYLDRSWDEYYFEDHEGENVEVIVFTEPDWEMEYEIAIDEGLRQDDWDDYAKKREKEFYKKGNGDVHVIWAGALDLTGTESEFAGRYPELYEHIKDNMVTI